MLCVYIRMYPPHTISGMEREAIVLTPHSENLLEEGSGGKINKFREAPEDWLLVELLNVKLICTVYPASLLSYFMCS